MNPCTALPPRPRRSKRGQPPASTKALQRRNALVESHRHLVPPVANHYWRRCPEPQDDLIQVGLLGLIRAAELFRPSQKTPFPAFARPHIRGAILHYLRDSAPVVRLPRRQSELQTRLHRLEVQMASGPGAPSEEELCRHLAMDVAQCQVLRRYRNLCRPAPLNPELLEDLSESASSDPREDDRESQARVEALLSALDPRTQQVLRWVVLQGWSYRRAGDALQVSAMTVQRCLHRGLAALRAKLRDSSTGSHHPPAIIPAGRKLGRAPFAAQGWPTRHSPPPAAAPGHLAKK